MSYTRSLLATKRTDPRLRAGLPLLRVAHNFGRQEIPLYYDPDAIRGEFDGVCREINLLGSKVRLYDLLMGWWERKSDRDLVEFIGDEYPIHRISFMGVGTGYLLRLVNKRFPNARIRGSDLAVNMLEVARQKLLKYGCPAKEVAVINGAAGQDREAYADERITLVQEDCRRSTAPDQSQDTIIAAYFLDLLSPHQIGEVLDEVERLLVAGGRAYLMSLTSDIERGQNIAEKTSRLYFRMRNGFYSIWYHSKFLRDVSHTLFDGYYTHCRPISLSSYVSGRAGLKETRAQTSYISICGIPYLPVRIIEVIKR